MPEITGEDDAVAELVEEFSQRWRAGERPSAEEYARRYPQWADKIRAILRTVVMMKQLRPANTDAAPEHSPAPCPTGPPERLGEYRIVREIGRGGMGVVYEAEQEALGRRVALKMLLPGPLLANAKLRLRFRHEAQAAARLHHTNIVPVFAVGECDGQCYYVMQLIHGRGLDQIIRAVAANGIGSPAGLDDALTVFYPPPAPPAAIDTPAGSRPKIPTPTTVSTLRSTFADSSPGRYFQTIARIGAQIADALNYAHAQGVLHRDIKPSNLLLDNRGTVWVTDFGVAKLLEGANLTQPGDFVGTLKYMPPEQFAGQSDARGDIYSLGATLYELLTLRPAFPDATPQQLIQLITEQEPIHPRILNRQIPKDLETIVLKAMAREPGQRYQTPAELAADLHRFLEGRTILARRAGPLEQMWSWCRRNPALASANAMVFLLMLGVTFVAAVTYLQSAANNKSDTTEREVAAANQDKERAQTAERIQRERAENVSALALVGFNQTFVRFTPTRLVVTPGPVSAERAELPPPRAVLPPEAFVLLQQLLPSYEQLAQECGEFPRLSTDVAEAIQRIGDFQQRLGQLNKADASYRTAIGLYARLSNDANADTVRIKLARACIERGRTLQALQQFDEAQQLRERALQTLTEAPRGFTDRPECRFELARSYHALAQRVPFLAAEPAAPDRAVEILERLVDEHPTVPEYRHLLACCYRDIPATPNEPGPPPGKRHPDRALEMLRQLVSEFPLVPDYRLDVCETLARLALSPREDAAPGDVKNKHLLIEAITTSVELVAKYPDVPAYTAAHARFLDQLGIRFFEAKNYEEAERLHRNALGFQSKLVQQYPEIVAYNLSLGFMERSLGRLLAERGVLDEARDRLQTAIDRVETIWKKDPRLVGLRPFLGLAYRDLARVHTSAGREELAIEARRKSEEFVRDGVPGTAEPQR